VPEVTLVWNSCLGLEILPGYDLGLKVLPYFRELALFQKTYLISDNLSYFRHFTLYQASLSYLRHFILSQTSLTYIRHFVLSQTSLIYIRHFVLSQSHQEKVKILKLT
jgi:hypothetical protein